MLNGNKDKGENHRAGMLFEKETPEPCNRDLRKALPDKATLE